MTASAWRRRCLSRLQMDNTTMKTQTSILSTVARATESGWNSFPPPMWWKWCGVRTAMLIKDTRILQKRPALIQKNTAPCFDVNLGQMGFALTEGGLTMTDCISREAAWNGIYNCPTKTDADGYIWVRTKDVAHMIDDIPAADVVPMDFHDRCMQIEIEKRMNLVTHGKWIKVPGYASPGGDPVWACSKCGKGLHVWGIEAQSYGKDVADHQWVSCPNCGTVMEE